MTGESPGLREERIQTSERAGDRREPWAHGGESGELCVRSRCAPHQTNHRRTPAHVRTAAALIRGWDRVTERLTAIMEPVTPATASALTAPLLLCRVRQLRTGRRTQSGTKLCSHIGANVVMWTRVNTSGLHIRCALRAKCAG